MLIYFIKTVLAYVLAPTNPIYFSAINSFYDHRTGSGFPVCRWANAPFTDPGKIGHFREDLELPPKFIPSTLANHWIAN